MDDIKKIIEDAVKDCTHVSYNIDVPRKNCDYIARKYLERGDISTACDLYINYDESCDKVCKDYIESLAADNENEKRIIPFKLTSMQLVDGKNVVDEEAWDLLVVSRKK